jgi:hypothetical protein
MIPAKIPNETKNVVLKGSQFFAYDRIRRDMKLIGGPVRKGRKQPMMPIKAIMKPKVKRTTYT